MYDVEVTHKRCGVQSYKHKFKIQTYKFLKKAGEFPKGQ